MRLYYFFIIILVALSSCKKEEEEVSFANDYGAGMYISTSNGVSFFDGDSVKNHIYRNVNGTILSDVKKIKFKENKAYVLAVDRLYVANIETFAERGYVGNFIDAVDFEFVSPEDRAFVVDKGDSKVKVVDIERMEITSDIETGDATNPVFIITKWYRSIVMNGGAPADSLKDSTIVAIDYKDELVPLADMMGSLYVGENPNSGVNINNLKVLCKGIYDSNDLSTQTQSTLATVNPWDMVLTSTKTLNGIYNAHNLLSNDNDNRYYFTAHDGVYRMNNTGGGIVQLLDIVSDVLFFQTESYNNTDTTTALSRMIYINDSENNPGYIYKYNEELSLVTDTIIVDGSVRDISYY